MGPVTVLLAFLAITATSLAQKASHIRELADALSTDLSAPDACHILPALLDGATKSAGGNDFDLLDVVLVASVDGRFHALNRTSGQTLWSMSSSATAAPSGLAPLVRTSHVETDPDTTDDDDAPHQELYIIEPQTGDIYVMASPTSPLQRLPFSMSELVDMSPYSSSGEDYTRVFVGRKETSLLLIELETGKVKAAVNSECPWDPFEDLAETDVAEESDDPEGSRPPRPTSTEVFIGRIGEMLYPLSTLRHS
jgi:serine/threonine-protein kinase/endoribonuclease IRE1